MVLHQGHLGDEVSRLDQLRLGIAAGHDDVLVGSKVRYFSSFSAATYRDAAFGIVKGLGWRPGASGRPGKEPASESLRRRLINNVRRPCSAPRLRNRKFA